jgi:putative inorganic carbon (HCO3(-)) transporter
MLTKGQHILFNRFSWLYLLLFFPIVDYILRQVLPIPIISSLWDEGVLVILTLICGWRIIETNRKLPSLKTPFLAFVVLGLGLLIADMNHFLVNIEGFRAVFQYMLAFFIGYYLLHNQGQAATLARIMVVVASAVGAYGLLQVILGVETPMHWSDSSENIRTRAFSIVQSPNILGSYMALMSPIAFGLAFLEKGKKRWLWVLLGLLMLSALLFTLSRGAWLAFAAALGLISIFFDRRLLIILLVAAILALFFVPAVGSRITNLFSEEYIEKSSKDGRIARWLGAYDMMRDNPFYGLGLGHYGGAVGERNFGTIYVDSYYFKTLAETGLTGLALYFWLMGALVKDAYRIWRKQTNKRVFYFYASVMAGLFAVIIHNAVENIFEVPFMNTYFWLLAGVFLSYPYLMQSNAGGEEVQ